MTKKVLIIDFDDSFTFNISELCHRWGIQNKVLSFREIDFSYIEKNKPHSLIWGAGPGHPDDYQASIALIAKVALQTNVYQIGICLGHQMYLRAFGLEIVSAPVKRHGSSLEITLPAWDEFAPEFYGRSLEVQFYSSLAVKAPELASSNDFLLSKDRSILSSRGAKHLTFQFHLESVGTSCPESFLYGWRKQLIQ